MIPGNFKRPKKSKETFVSGGVNIEDVNITHPKPTIEKEASVRMQVYLTQSHREWLRRKAYEKDSKMSNILRTLIDQAMNEED